MPGVAIVVHTMGSHPRCLEQGGSPGFLLNDIAHSHPEVIARITANREGVYGHNHNVGVICMSFAWVIVAWAGVRC